MKTRIYGASDDLIEIEGAIREELDCYDEKLKLTFSDGTSFWTEYDGQWRFKHLVKGDKFIKHIEAVGDEQVHLDEDSEEVPNYSDFILLDEGIEWVKVKGRKYKAV